MVVGQGGQEGGVGFEGEAVEEGGGLVVQAAAGGEERGVEGRAGRWGAEEVDVDLLAEFGGEVEEG